MSVPGPSVGHPNYNASTGSFPIDVHALTRDWSPLQIWDPEPINRPSGPYGDGHTDEDAWKSNGRSNSNVATGTLLYDVQDLTRSWSPLQLSDSEPITCPTDTYGDEDTDEDAWRSGLNTPTRSLIGEDEEMFKPGKMFRGGLNPLSRYDNLELRWDPAKMPKHTSTTSLVPLKDLDKERSFHKTSVQTDRLHDPVPAGPGKSDLAPLTQYSRAKYKPSIVTGPKSKPAKLQTGLNSTPFVPPSIGASEPQKKRQHRPYRHFKELPSPDSRTPNLVSTSKEAEQITQHTPGSDTQIVSHMSKPSKVGAKRKLRMDAPKAIEVTSSLSSEGFEILPGPVKNRTGSGQGVAAKIASVVAGHKSQRDATIDDHYWAHGCKVAPKQKAPHPKQAS